MVGLAVCALMLAGLSPAKAAETVDVLHVFLAAGQSNMSGRGLPGGGSEDQVDPRIFQYGAKVRTFRPGTVPLDMHDNASGISPATAFAREYLKTQPANVGVLIIPAAHGGTGFTSAAAALDGSEGTLTWTPGAASAPELGLPELAVTQTLEGIAAARAAGHKTDLKGILWHQGENNATLTTSGYSARLDALIGFFRSQLAAPNLPVVVGQMAPEGIAADPVRLNVDRSHRETPSRVASTGFAGSTAGGTNSGDIIHFSRIGVEYLGKTYLSGYAQAAATIADTGSLTAPVPAIVGDATVGSILTAVPGGWGPAPVSLAYQWYRSGTAIVGATGASYTPDAGDLGRTITVKVTGSKTGYTTISRVSTGTATLGRGSLTAPVPAISGDVKVGSPLTVVAGVWGPDPVTLAYQWYRSGTAIIGATGAAWTPAAGDLGRTITVRVTGAKPGYTTVSRISAGSIVAGALTVPVPSITGEAKVGSILTAVPGAWGPAPVTLGYQWYRSGAPVFGANAATYKVRSGDLGQTVTVKVTGSKTGYTTASQNSAATATIAEGSLTAPVPAITGDATVGSVLTAVPGAWGPAPVSLAYQWYRSGTAIVGATGATYTPDAGDMGRTITVKVTGSKTGYTTISRVSTGTATLGRGSLTAPVPAISGDVKVGSPLTVVAGVWGPDPVTLAYQWYRSGTAIIGATGTAYTPAAGDLGRTITVRVTGAKPGYTTVSRISAGSIVAGALTVPVPSITGEAKVGSILTAVPGAWGPAPVTLGYQWYRSGVAVFGANAATYKVRSGDLGQTVTVKVTGSKTGYTTASQNSAATATIAEGSLAAPVPAITGDATVGSVLTAVPGAWGPAPVSLAYQWYRSGTAIVGATGATYTPDAGDMGRTITVKVAGSKTGYTTTIKTSTGRIVYGALTAPVPAIGGDAKVGSRLSVVAGVWGPDPVALAYQWYRSGTAISGATGTAYTPAAGDLGGTITVKVTGTKSGYATASTTSVGTAAIEEGTLSAPAPTITGTRQVGFTLTAVPGAWGPDPVTLAYQWYRSGSAISDATGATYKARTADAGQTITVKVTGSKPGYATAAKTSVGTAAIAKGTLTSPVPTITGTAAAGSTLTAVPGDWGPAPVALTYQWYRSGTAIIGASATAPAYTPGAGDVGRTITVKVTGSKTGYTTTTKTSAGVQVAG
ncbi:sialate O-acetylesterase [Pseudarthrobacter sp. PvP090]|uniref:sialate O-acetylesterase n=1 Tax=Pseudarthrobacter sp. PvP090 TaxID=3156393 RepID=UPI003391ECCF